MAWNQTMMMDVANIIPGDRVSAVHGPMNMPWISTNRINKYVTNFDFTNTHIIDDYNSHNVLIYFDLMSCQFVVIDYTHGKHGCFGIAQTIDNNDVFHISLITEDSGLKILKTVQIIQRAWRKKIANRHFNNITIPLCLSICRKRRMQYFIDPVSNRMWWWVDDKSGLDMYGSFGWFD